MKVLVAEFGNNQRRKPNHAEVMMLLKFTFNVRRERITQTSASMLSIQEEYPFFKDVEWVSHSFILIINFFFTLNNNVQVLKEFELMTEEGVVEKMEEKWKSLLPSIFKLDDAYGTCDDEAADMQALTIIDSQLRPAGTGAKSVAAYAMYEVCVHVYTLLSHEVCVHVVCVCVYMYTHNMWACYVLNCVWCRHRCMREEGL